MNCHFIPPGLKINLMFLPIHSLLMTLCHGGLEVDVSNSLNIDALTCPVCLEPAKVAPVYQCKPGHLIFYIVFLLFKEIDPPLPSQ